MKKISQYLSFALLALIFLVEPSFSAESKVGAETQYVFNTLLFLICGFLVMFMAPGFAMLESGMVSSKSVASIATKNIGLFAIAGIMFWLGGYNLAYGIPEGGYIGHSFRGVMVQNLILDILMDQIGSFKWFSVQRLFQ